MVTNFFKVGIQTLVIENHVTVSFYHPSFKKILSVNNKGQIVDTAEPILSTLVYIWKTSRVFSYDTSLLEALWGWFSRRF